jgi:hypothetical protein
MILNITSDDIYAPILLASGLALLGWFLREQWLNYLTRRSINLYLKESIKDAIFSMIGNPQEEDIGQIDKLKDWLDISNGRNEYLTVTYFPLFTTEFFKSFPKQRLRSAYWRKDKFMTLMNVIGYIDGFEGRKPRDIQQNWIDWIEVHKKECEVTPYYNCDSVAYEIRMCHSNLEHIRVMAEKLLVEVNKILS